MSTQTTHPASSRPDRAVADRLVARLRGIPGVADLHPGRYGEVALLFPRHRVVGLRHTPEVLEVHLVVDLSDLSAARPLAEVAAEVRDVVTQELADTPPHLEIVFADATGGTP